MRPPTVSVLMTAYNRAAYIAVAIESVLAQTFRDFELLIVDDCSSDDTVRIAERYAVSDDRVRVLRNAQNLGDYANRNHAARAARGQLLKFHDSDDVMYPHCLQVMVPLLLAHPDAAMAVSARCAWPGGPAPMQLTPQMSYAREFLGSGAFMGGPATALIRREPFEAIGGFRAGGAASDYMTWLQLCARYPIVLVPADLFWYRTHPQQELESQRAQRDYARVHGHAWQALRDPSCPLAGAELDQARRNALWRLLVLLSRDIRRHRWALALYRFRQTGLSAGDFMRYARLPKRVNETSSWSTTSADFTASNWVQPSPD